MYRFLNGKIKKSIHSIDYCFIQNRFFSSFCFSFNSCGSHHPHLDLSYCFHTVWNCLLCNIQHDSKYHLHLILLAVRCLQTFLVVFHVFHFSHQNHYLWAVKLSFACCMLIEHDHHICASTSIRSDSAALFFKWKPKKLMLSVNHHFPIQNLIFSTQWKKCCC